MEQPNDVKIMPEKAEEGKCCRCGETNRLLRINFWVLCTKDGEDITVEYHQNYCMYCLNNLFEKERVGVEFG